MRILTLPSALMSGCAISPLIPQDTSFKGRDLADYRQHRAEVRASLQAKADTGRHIHTQGVSPGTQTALRSGATPPETVSTTRSASSLSPLPKSTGLAIVFECLKGIRDRCRFRKGAAA